MSDNHEQFYQEDGHPHLVAECAVCGFRFDIMFGLDCPQCRIARVQKVFRPLDPLRTAEALKARLDASMGDIEDMVDQQAAVRWHGPRLTAAQIRAYDEIAREKADPSDFKMPLDYAAEVYELRRMFRL